MRCEIYRRFGYLLTVFFLCLSPAGATSVPSLSLEELTGQSELIVSGQINRSWADWDAEHKYIWTHYELSVSSALKGNPAATVVMSEPGGVVGIQGMTIAGAVTYSAGDKVVVFLQRMPNGYLRTTGWSQGKYTLDPAGMLHAEPMLNGLEIVNAGAGRPPSGPRSLSGLSVAQLRAMIAAGSQAGKR